MTFLSSPAFIEHWLYPVHYAYHFTHINSFHRTLAQWGSAILQMGKLRLGQVNWLAQDHVARKAWSLDLPFSCLTSELMCSASLRPAAPHQSPPEPSCTPKVKSFTNPPYQALPQVSKWIDLRSCSFKKNYLFIYLGCPGSSLQCAGFWLRGLNAEHGL